MRSMVAPGSQAEQVGRLLLAGFVVVALSSLPFGNYLAYPFTILTTWFHEMGHGLTALATGQDFQQLRLYSSRSGVAEYTSTSDTSSATHALIAAGGLLAPSVVGAVLIAASAHERLWRPALWAMAAALFASVILYVRSTVGFAVLPMIAAAISLIAWKAPAGAARFALQFLGLLGALSMLSHWRYLFTKDVVIDGQAMLSDTGQIEAALFLPYWLWGVLVILASAVMVGASLKYALSDERRGPPKRKLPANVLQFKRTPDKRR